MISFESTLFSSFMYFFMIFILEVEAILFMVIMTSLLSKWIKSAEISYFIPFKSLLIFATCALEFAKTLSTLFVLMGMIICFLDKSLVVIFSLGLPLLLELDMTLWMSRTLLGGSSGKASLILMILLMLLLEAWAYGQL